MDTRAFDGLARQIGRRRTLQALSGALVATASGITAASAKKNSNKQKSKQRKKKQEKLRQRIDQESLALCANQVPECVTLLTENCGEDAECQALGETCCQELADCDFQGLIACFAV